MHGFMQNGRRIAGLLIFFMPGIILETDLHNDCGLIAAAAWKYLTSHGIKARILHIRYGKREGHAVTIFECDGRLKSYDQDGCLTYSRDASWKTPPKLLAKAWQKANNPKRKVVDGKWL